MWERLRRGSDEYDVFLMNDRGGIYALGLPVTSALGHLVNLAELTVLALGTYLCWSRAMPSSAWRDGGGFGRRRTARGSRQLLSQVFLAFVAA